MRKSKIFMQENPKSPIAEAFRTLRTNIQFSNIDKPIKSMVITSSGPGEGKSTVSVNLATTIVQSGKSVLLIECDLRKPTVYKYFNINSLKGLTNILVGNEKHTDVLYSAKRTGKFHVITSGPIPPNPAELLGSKKMKDFIKNMEKEYDMVILDAPPIGVVTDSAVLSTVVDGTLLVCCVGQVDINSATRAKDLLDKVNANVLGVVLNKVPIDGGSYYKHHYDQYYDSAYYSEGGSNA